MGGFLDSKTPEQSSQVLNASCGPVRGNIYQHNSKLVHGYLGIPYAKPPIGPLRFQKPVPSDPWQEPRDCYHYGPGCPQSGDFSGLFASQKFAEDNCLTLNVFVPRPNSGPLPVMVYIHGGGFETGGSSLLHDYSLSGTLPLKDVILVTINYRLGPLGFLVTHNSSGNYGLWDQTLALQWVQKHIGSFGGDPGNVTIFGTSAGGVSVDLLALSPHSNQLFQRFIASSGTAFCELAIREKEEQVNVFKRFAEFHRFQGGSGNGSGAPQGSCQLPEPLLQWYQSQPSSLFRDTKGFNREASGFLSFLPNFDGDFFPKPFDQLRKEAPTMEAIIITGEYEGLGWQETMVESWETLEGFRKAIRKVFGPDIVSNVSKVQKMILEAYTNVQDPTDKKIMDRKITEFIGDAWFNTGALDSAKSLAKHGNTVYLGSFNYYHYPSNHPIKPYFPFEAAAHGADLQYALGDGGLFEFKPTEEELKMMDRVASYMTDFAKFGNPNGNHSTFWDPYTLQSPLKHLKINYPTSEMSDNYQNGRLAIYDEINEKYGKKYQKIVYGKDL